MPLNSTSSSINSTSSPLWAKTYESSRIESASFSRASVVSSLRETSPLPLRGRVSSGSANSFWDENDNKSISPTTHEDQILNELLMDYNPADFNDVFDESPAPLVEKP